MAEASQILGGITGWALSRFGLKWGDTNGLPVARQTFVNVRRRIGQRKVFTTFTEDELLGQRYLYLALHKEPEHAINFQSPLWHNQKNLIAWVSQNLPCGYRLLVRDHRKNEGRRPTAWYREVMAYPGVDLVSPLDDQFKYIRNADLIVTDNGSTGWEGLIFGKRVIALAPSFYEATGLTKTVTDPSRLGEIIIRRLAEPEVPDAAEWDRRLACLIEAEMETTVAADSSSYDRSLEIIASMLAEDRPTLATRMVGRAAPTASSRMEISGNWRDGPVHDSLAGVIRQGGSDAGTARVLGR